MQMGQLEAWRDETKLIHLAAALQRGLSRGNTWTNQQKPQWVQEFPSWLELLELSESPGCTQPDKSSWWLVYKSGGNMDHVVGKSAAQGRKCPHGALSSSACSISCVLPHPNLLTLLCLRAFCLPFPVPSLSQLLSFLSSSLSSLPLGPLEGSNSDPDPVSTLPASASALPLSRGEGWG